MKYLAMIVQYQVRNSIAVILEMLIELLFCTYRLLLKAMVPYHAIHLVTRLFGSPPFYIQTRYVTYRPAVSEGRIILTTCPRRIP